MTDNPVSKTWKFTDFDMTKRKFYEVCDCNVIAFGEEICPSTGRKHIQGHVSFKRAYRLYALKKLSSTAHWSIAKCEDFNYELKGDDVHIRDNRKKKGERTDWQEIKQKIIEGTSKRELALEFPSQYIRYSTGIEKFMDLVQTKTETSDYDLESCCKHLGLAPLGDAYTNIVIGPSGCGKTQFALAHFKNPFICSHIDDLKEFSVENDGIVFDDMDFKHLPRTAQIHLVDYDNTRSIHCRFRTAKIPKKTFKIFTCNHYPFIEDDAVRRRVTVTEVCLR